MTWNPLQQFEQQLQNTEQQLVKDVGNAVQGVERGAAAAMGGAVSDFLRLPQAVINIGYNLGGFIIGNALIFVGAGFLILAIFGDVVKDGLYEAAQAINPDGNAPKTENVIGKVVESAGTAASLAATL